MLFGKKNPNKHAQKKNIGGAIEIPTQLVFDLEHVRYGLCRSSDGSMRQMNHTIMNEEIARALQPIHISSPLFIPLLDKYPTVPIMGFELPTDVALEIAGFLGNVNDLDNLAATSAAFRAIARSRSVRDLLLQPWLSSNKRLLWAKNYCPRSLARTFSNIQQASSGNWGEVLWQSAALGCIHGIYLALEQGADVNEYSGGRQNQEGSALWVAAKFNHLEAVKVLCEESETDIEARGGIRTFSSPLWVAAREGNTDIIEYLFWNGADADSFSHGGHGMPVLRMLRRALHYGYGADGEKIVELYQTLKAHGASE